MTFDAAKKIESFRFEDEDEYGFNFKLFSRILEKYSTRKASL